MNFYVLRFDEDLDGVAYLKSEPDNLKAVIKSYELTKGISLLDRYPDDVVEFQMDADYPEDRLLVDLQRGISQLLIASAKLRAVIESSGQTDIEYLPIHIINHRGKLASNEYCIVNVVGCVDALDWENAVYELDPFRPQGDRVSIIRKLVLRQDVPTDREIFRFQQWPKLFIINETMKNKIEQAGCTGLNLVPVAQFRSAIH